LSHQPEEAGQPLQFMQGGGMLSNDAGALSPYLQQQQQQQLGSGALVASCLSSKVGPHGAHRHPVALLTPHWPNADHAVSEL
jgi:hypothetical protein